LGDTFFILFLNRRLLLLQWFHHMTTLLYVEYALHQRRYSSFWFIYMNVFVHSLMYLYYAYPCITPWIITLLQILQMIIGVSIVFRDTASGFDVFGCTMYSLYAFLFIDYFLSRYVFSTKKKRQ
jgi:hypothetical protein